MRPLCASIVGIWLLSCSAGLAQPAAGASRGVTEAPDKAEVFSQGFTGGPDAEQDSPGLGQGPREAPLLDPRDLNGLWKPGVTPRKRPRVSLDDSFLLEDPPLNPKARGVVEQFNAIKKSGKIAGSSTSTCRSPGIYTTIFPAFVMAIIQTRENIFIAFEQPRLVRKIHLGGVHPTNLRPSYAGHSIGRWEGDTLVVETVGFNGLGELDISGAPVSSSARMTERYTKAPDGRSVRLIATIEDPEYLTEPLVAERRWVLSNGLQQGEFDCEENPREDMDSQTTYLDPRYEPVCVRVEGAGAEPSRVMCRPPRAKP